ncbi:MAG: tetratricopeptide repeat protein [Bacteroidales bacterium]|nr:tetratricopeptide repeat protein [Bacteroidales bacterium]
MISSQIVCSENIHKTENTDSLSNYFAEKAIIYSDSSGNLSQEYAEKALYYAKINKKDKTLSNAYHALAIAYQEKGQFNEAISFFDSVIFYATKANYAYRLNTSHNNLGVILRKEGAFDAAIIQFEKALNYAYECGDTLSVAYCYSNIGNCYAANNEHSTAIINYSRALNIFMEMDDYEFNAAYIKNNIAGIFGRQNKYNSAKYYYQEALDYFKNTDNKVLSFRTLISLAELSLKENKLKEAEQFIEQAKFYEKIVDNQDILTAFYEIAHKVYTALNNLDKSVYYLDLFTATASEDQSTELKKLIMETLHQHEKLILEAEKKEVQNKLERKNLILVFAWILIIAVSGISLLIFINYRQKTRLNKQLQAQNTIIEAQNKQINDSIEYAKNIMRLSMVNSNLDASYIKDSFIFFRPRDIVGGDFYKISKDKDSTLIALADCTGHGISGAFLASVYYNLLNRSIQQGNKSLNKILQNLNSEHLNFFGKSDVDDISQLQSMVISLLQIGDNKIEFSGINQVLVHCNNKDVSIIKSNRYSLGSKENIEFDVKEIEYQSGDILILLSDGIIDQLNPNGNAKFSWKHFSKILSENCDKDLNTLKLEIENHWQNWKEDSKQTDDISVIGIRV